MTFSTASAVSSISRSLSVGWTRNISAVSPSSLATGSLSAGRIHCKFESSCPVGYRNRVLAPCEGGKLGFKPPAFVSDPVIYVSRLKDARRSFDLIQ